MVLSFERSDAFEMKQYGYDPNDEADIVEWDKTAPLNPDAPVDYSQDWFGFGSEPVDVTETDLSEAS